jgi:hypothetical protein
MKEGKVIKIPKAEIKAKRTKVKMMIVDLWNLEKGTPEYNKMNKEITKLTKEIEDTGENWATDNTVSSQVEEYKKAH